MSLVSLTDHQINGTKFVIHQATVTLSFICFEPQITTQGFQSTKPNETVSSNHFVISETFFQTESKLIAHHFTSQTTRLKLLFLTSFQISGSFLAISDILGSVFSSLSNSQSITFASSGVAKNSIEFWNLSFGKSSCLADVCGADKKSASLFLNSSLAL